MKFKRHLLSALALGLLSSCHFSSPTVMNPGFYSLQAQRFSRFNTPQKIETLVNQERMQANLAILTGVKPVLPNTLIPERGTREGRALTRQFLTQYLENLGYTVERHEYRRDGANIFVRLMAEKPTDEYIVVGAHLDSVRNAGADDNGSGSTAVLEAATILPQLKGRQVNIIFAWFDEEELGLVGSRYLAREFKKQNMKITSMHNVDMLGYDGDKDKVIELARPEGVLWDYYNMVNKTHGLNLPLERTSTAYSDHVSFAEEGYHSLMLIEEYTSQDTTPHYHRRGDQFPTIHFDYLANGTRLLVAAVGDLALKVPPPKNIQIIPHERFPSRIREFHKDYDSIDLDHGH